LALPKLFPFSFLFFSISSSFSLSNSGIASTSS
jgi:hypothetical protein